MEATMEHPHTIWVHPGTVRIFSHPELGGGLLGTYSSEAEARAAHPGPCWLFEFSHRSGHVSCPDRPAEQTMRR